MRKSLGLVALATIVTFVAWCRYQHRAGADECFFSAAQNVPCPAAQARTPCDQRTLGQMQCLASTYQVIYAANFTCGNVPMQKKNCPPQTDSNNVVMQGMCCDVYVCEYDADFGECYQGAKTGSCDFQNLYKTVDCN